MRQGWSELFEPFFRRFGIASPVPAWRAFPVAFQNRIEDHTKFSHPTTRAQFFTDTLVVSERVALYRYLLGADAALAEHRRLRHAFDRATEGRHQASSRRRAQLHARREHRDSMAESNYELPTASPAVSAVMPSPDFPSEHSMNIFGFRDQIIHDYATYIKSFIQIRNTRISEYAGQNLNAGILWPEPLIQLNPTFQDPATGLIHGCAKSPASGVCPYLS